MTKKMDKLKEVKKDKMLTEAAKRRIINSALDKIKKENKRFIDKGNNFVPKKQELVHVNKALNAKTKEYETKLMNKLTFTNYHRIAENLTTTYDCTEERFETTYAEVSQNLWNLSAQQVAYRLNRVNDPNLTKEEFVSALALRHEEGTIVSKKSSIFSGDNMRTLLSNSTKKRGVSQISRNSPSSRDKMSIKENEHYFDQD